MTRIERLEEEVRALARLVRKLDRLVMGEIPNPRRTPGSPIKKKRKR